MASPLAPPSRSISITSVGATRYCLPPVLMTAYIPVVSIFPGRSSREKSPSEVSETKRAATAAPPTATNYKDGGYAVKEKGIRRRLQPRRPPASVLAGGAPPRFDLLNREGEALALLEGEDRK